MDSNVMYLVVAKDLLIISDYLTVISRAINLYIFTIIHRFIIITDNLCHLYMFPSPSLGWLSTS